MLFSRVGLSFVNCGSRGAPNRQETCRACEGPRVRGCRKPSGASLVATVLHLHDVISTELMDNILRFSDSLNTAVHGEEITRGEADAAIEVGTRILRDPSPHFREQP